MLCLNMPNFNLNIFPKYFHNLRWTIGELHWSLSTGTGLFLIPGYSCGKNSYPMEITTRYVKDWFLLQRLFFRDGKAESAHSRCFRAVYCAESLLIISNSQLIISKFLTDSNVHKLFIYKYIFGSNFTLCLIILGKRCHTFLPRSSGKVWGLSQKFNKNDTFTLKMIQILTIFIYETSSSIHFFVCFIASRNSF